MREYLRDQADTIELGALVSQYRNAVVEFHDWFAEAVRERNRPAFQEFEKGKQELSRYGAILFGPALNDPQSE